MKKCYKCGEEKDISEFYNDKQRPDGKSSRNQQCEECRNKKKEEEEREYKERREEFAMKFLDGNTTSRALAREIFDLREELKNVKDQLHSHQWDL